MVVVELEACFKCHNLFEKEIMVPVIKEDTEVFLCPVCSGEYEVVEQVRNEDGGYTDLVKKETYH